MRPKTAKKDYIVAHHHVVALKFNFALYVLSVKFCENRLRAWERQGLKITIPHYCGWLLLAYTTACTTTKAVILDWLSVEQSGQNDYLHNLYQANIAFVINLEFLLQVHSFIHSFIYLLRITSANKTVCNAM